MSIRDQSAIDARAIIVADGDAVTLTSPVIPAVLPALPTPGTVYSLKGLYNRVGIERDAEGMAIPADKSTLTVSLADLMAAGLAEPEDLKKPGWRVDVADALGVMFTGRIDTPLLDRSLGIVTLILKKGAP